MNPYQRSRFSDAVLQAAEAARASASGGDSPEDGAHSRGASGHGRSGCTPGGSPQIPIHSRLAS